MIFRPDDGGKPYVPGGIGGASAGKTLYSLKNEQRTERGRAIL